MKRKKWIWENRRLLVLLTFAVIEVVVIIISWDKIDNFIKCNQIHKDWLKAVIPLLIAAPVALLIWYWRDQNKREDIENDRSVILQKDFHQIEEWATESDGVLQVAAIHQLHPYATGLNGTDFQKPASEIYKALLSAWAEEAEAKAKARGLPPEDPIWLTRPSHIETIHKIVKKDWREFPKDFLPGIYLGHADLKKANLEGADLDGAEYSEETEFPDGFDPQEHGMVLMVRIEDKKQTQ